MKKAALFHSTGGSPTEHWLGWATDVFKASGYETFVPHLPESSTPNKDTYDAFLRASGWDFKDNVLLGHSSGATTILNLLTEEWFPHVKAVILVGTFLNERLTKPADWYVPGQFDNLFKDNYDPAVLREKADAFYFVHGSDDPFCDIEDARSLCNAVGGEFLVIPNGHHLGGGSGRTELCEMEAMLQNQGVLQKVDIQKAAAVIIRDRKLLVARSAGKDIFIAPGGKLEHGETVEEALVRELDEEIQIDARPENFELLGEYYGEAAGKVGVMLKMYVLQVHAFEGEPVPSSEVEELRWIDSTTDIALGSIFQHDVIPMLKSRNLID